MPEAKPQRVEQVRRINRSSTDKPTSNVLTLKTHELVVATDYVSQEIELIDETFELVGGGAAAGYKQVSDPARDLIEIEGVLALEFDGLLDRGSYSLFVQSAGEEPLAIFEDVPFLKLGVLSPDIDEEIKMHGEDGNLGRE